MRYFPSEIISVAKKNSPLEILKKHGYVVKNDGKSNYKIIKDGITLVRLTKKYDGAWLWVGQSIPSAGDNISLIMELLQTNFPNAVYLLTDSSYQCLTTSYQHTHKSTQPTEIILPQANPQSLPFIYHYLSNIRGISHNTINFALNTGFIRFISTGVVFCGYDNQHRLRNADFRAAFEYIQPQKRCLYGSDKHFPPVLMSKEQSKIWIVEGGFDALALRDCALRQGVIPPLVIVSGGANVCHCFDNPQVQALLKQAIKVTVAFDNEATQSIQNTTNAAHVKQIQSITNLVNTSCLVTTFMPQKDKDLASMNLRISRNKN